MEYLENYKGIKGWFPKSVVELIEEFNYIQKRKESFKIWTGKDLSEEDIEKIKVEYRNLNKQ